jgi:hypothetical protein
MAMLNSFFSFSLKTWHLVEIEYNTIVLVAGMAELADAWDLKFHEGDLMPVQARLPAGLKKS